MYLCSLGSGSSGNAIIVRSAAHYSVLIDCGVQYPRLTRNLAQVGIAPSAIDAIVLSHEHTDHTQSAPLFAATFGTLVIASTDLQRLRIPVSAIVSETFAHGETFAVGDIAITPLRVSHDASATYGFVVTADGVSAAIFTDLGHGTPSVCAAAAAADLVIVEANYDGEMLESGSYPWFLKARIRGGGGHLSNADCAALLASAFTRDTPRDVWLAHLSKNNNTPERAVATVASALREANLHAASVTALPRYTIGPTWEAIRHQQLTLFPT